MPGPQGCVEKHDIKETCNSTVCDTMLIIQYCQTLLFNHGKTMSFSTIWPQI